MDLAQLTNQPTVIKIGGGDYLFSEIPFAGLGELQQWLKDNTPHPLRSLAGQLDGFGDDDRAELLRQAREDAKRWPPQIGTAAGTAALLNTEAGQVKALEVALGVHQAATPELARKLYKSLQSEAVKLARKKSKDGVDGEAKISRIFAIAFGMEEDGETSDPKA
jgi:hypothetical protein